MTLGRAERYLTRLRQGSIRNTGEQTGEEKVSTEINTDPYPNYDFGNQCPDDFHKNTLQSSSKKLISSPQNRSPSKLEAEENKNDGLGSVEPENNLENKNLLLQGQEASSMISYYTAIGNGFLEYLFKNDGNGQGMPKNSEYCLDFKNYLSVLTNDNFISRIEWISGSELVIIFRCLNVEVEKDQNEGQSQSLNLIFKIKNKEISKIFVCESQVSAVQQASDQELLIVGTVDGSLLAFNGQESDFQHKNSSFINEKKLNQLWSSNKMTSGLPSLRYCSYSTDFSFESHSSAVVSMISEGSQIFSLEEMGVLTAWTCTSLPLDVYISNSFTKLTKNFSLKIPGEDINLIERSFFSLAVKSPSDPKYNFKEKTQIIRASVFENSEQYFLR